MAPRSMISLILRLSTSFSARIEQYFRVMMVHSCSSNPSMTLKDFAVSTRSSSSSSQSTGRLSLTWCSGHMTWPPYRSAWIFIVRLTTHEGVAQCNLRKTFDLLSIFDKNDIFFFRTLTLVFLQRPDGMVKQQSIWQLFRK